MNTEKYRIGRKMGDMGQQGHNVIYKHVLKPLDYYSSIKDYHPLDLIDDMETTFNNMRLLMDANALSVLLDHGDKGSTLLGLGFARNALLLGLIKV